MGTFEPVGVVERYWPLFQIPGHSVTKLFNHTEMSSSDHTVDVLLPSESQKLMIQWVYDNYNNYSNIQPINFDWLIYGSLNGENFCKVKEFKNPDPLILEMEFCYSYVRIETVSGTSQYPLTLYCMAI